MRDPTPLIGAITALIGAVITGVTSLVATSGKNKRDNFNEAVDEYKEIADRLKSDIADKDKQIDILLKENDRLRKKISRLEEGGNKHEAKH